MYVKYFKRSLDLLLSAVALVVLLPLFFLLAVAIKLDSPGPVFFRQKRIGAGKTEFMLFKFRTMYTDAPKESPTHLLENAATYITRFGRWLRKTSLDELPQLVNILLGQMSIVGPRPALWNQSDLIEARDRYGANSLRPGLTGLAQINGRDELEIETKAQLDGVYATNISFKLDCRCFFTTIKKVLRADGIVEGIVKQ